MTDGEKGAFKGILTNVGSLAIALVFMFAFHPIASLFFEPGPIVKHIGLAGFFAIILLDPVTAYFEIKTGKRTLKSYLYRMMMTFLVVSVAVPLFLALTSLATSVENKAISMVLIMVPPLLIMPLMFMMPHFRRRFGKQEPEAVDLGEDAQIAMIFPLYTTLTMFLTLGTAGALALVDAPAVMGLFLAIAAVLVAVTETWTAEDDELIDLDEQAKWGGRAKSAEEAWAGFKKAIAPGITSSIFMGSTIYMGLALSDFGTFSSINDLDGIEVLLSIFKPMGTMLVVTLSMIFFAVFLVAAAAWGIATLKGADPLSMAELAKQSFARLLMGGMSHVRPDLDTD